MFIDIHNHTLFGVDDGPKEIETAIKMLEEAKAQGADAIVLTPHYRKGMFAYPVGKIESNFASLAQAAKKIGVRLYLGCEYHVNSDLISNIQSRKCRTLAESDYILTEYSWETEYTYIAEQTQRLLFCGYIPVIAHVERYQCFRKQPALCVELSNMGAMIQINADSVLGHAGFQAKQFCKKLLSRQWADVIASDAHDLAERSCRMGECRSRIEKKYGNEYAEALFVTNPMRIIKNI